MATPRRPLFTASLRSRTGHATAAAKGVHPTLHVTSSLRETHGIVALAPGDEFEVFVKGEGISEDDSYTADLYVNGRDVGYGRVLSAEHPTYVFRGWAQPGTYVQSRDSIPLRAFQVNTAAPAEPRMPAVAATAQPQQQQPVDAPRHDTIRVEFWRASESIEVSSDEEDIVQEQERDAVPHQGVVDDKKWFLRPGLSIHDGQPLHPDQAVSPARCVCESTGDAPVHVFTIRYDTLDRLTLRGEVNLADPATRAKLLQDSPSTVVRSQAAALMAAHRAGLGSGGSSSGSGIVRVSDVVPVCDMTGDVAVWRQVVKKAAA